MKFGGGTLTIKVAKLATDTKIKDIMQALPKNYGIKSYHLWDCGYN